jgi:hypothetical protein
VIRRVADSFVAFCRQTAKGDVNGIIFDHMNAASSVLAELMPHSNNMPENLKDFIVEYYVDVVTISMISIDPSCRSAPPPLGAEFETLAKNMVRKGYTGQLCGSWLELLLLIPRIFDFASDPTRELLETS